MHCYRGCAASDFLLLAAALCLYSPVLCRPPHTQRECTSGSSDLDALAREAELQIAANNLNAAIACAEEAVRISKAHPRGLELVAKVCISGGDLSCCAQFCDQAWEQRTGSSGHGEVLPSSSLGLCRSGADLSALLMCGNCYASAEAWQPALARYTAATSCAHTLPPRGHAARDGMAEALANAYNNMGNVLRLQHADRVHDAVEAYLGAAEWQPQLDDAWYNAGSLLIEEGAHPTRAADLLGRAVCIAPLNPENWRALTSVLPAVNLSDTGRFVERARRLLVRLSRLPTTLEEDRGDGVRRARVDQRSSVGPPSPRDLAALAAELLRAGEKVGGKGKGRAESLSMVRRVILGLLRGEGQRESAVSMVLQIGKDLVRHGHTTLGKSVIRMVHVLLGGALTGKSALTAGELWTLGAALASNEMRDYDSAGEALERAVVAGQIGALPVWIAALQTTCRWEDVAEQLQVFAMERERERRAPPAGTGSKSLTRRPTGLPASPGQGREDGAGGRALHNGLGAYEALYFDVDLEVLRAAAEDAAASLNGVASLRAPDAYFPLPLLWEGLGARDAAGEGKVRIGYLSSDIKLSHPIGQLLVPVLQAHQSARTAAVCIDTHEQGLARSPAAWQEQVHASCAGGFLHLRRHAAWRAAEAINDLGVHVLVNLNGWAGEDRLDVLTYRPAPLQVNALGYAGTSGCTFIDAVLSDGVSSPPELRAHYSETLLLLPPSHHVLPHAPLYGDAQSTPLYPREALGLPSAGHGPVFACFNRVKKLDVHTWQTWLKILQGIPGAVLWLVRLAMSKETEARLKTRARAAGVDPSRIVLTDTLASAEHISAKSHGDVFLDTPVYNAHVTAGDAIWAGLPLVVMPLESMAARISASFAFAFPGAVLVARTRDEYGEMAMALARRPQLRAQVRAHIMRQRASAHLFQVERWVRHFEAALRMVLEAGISSSLLGALSSVADAGAVGSVARRMDVVVASSSESRRGQSPRWDVDL